MSILAMPAMTAGGTIRRARFVKGGAANHVVLEADANERTIGIATDSGREAAIPSVTADPPEAAQSGDQLEVRFLGERALLELGSGGATVFGRLKSDNDGKGVLIATNGTTIQQVGAIALESGSEGEMIEVQVVMYSERPALA